MDRRLGLAALIATPALAALFHLLGQSGLRPLTAALAGMGVYWTLLVLGLTQTRWSLALRWPPLGVALGLGVALAVIVVLAMPSVTRLSAHVLLVVALAALLNGTLEEAFWRGALVPTLTGWRDGVLPVLAFTLWHLAPAVVVARLDAPGGVPGLLLGALGLGAVAMGLRLVTGTAGAAAALHVIVNFCTFAGLAARNPGTL